MTCKTNRNPKQVPSGENKDERRDGERQRETEGDRGTEVEAGKDTWEGIYVLCIYRLTQSISSLVSPRQSVETTAGG